jgi:hypothetical protein
MAATDVSARNKIARVEVVPWSMARTYGAKRFFPYSSNSADLAAASAAFATGVSQYKDLLAS